MKLVLTTERVQLGSWVYTVYVLRTETISYVSRGPLWGILPPLWVNLQVGVQKAHHWWFPWMAVLWAKIFRHALSANVSYVFDGHEVSLHVANWSLNRESNMQKAIARLKMGPSSKPRDGDKVWVYYYLQQCHPGQKPIFSYRYVAD